MEAVRYWLHHHVIPLLPWRRLRGKWPPCSVCSYERCWFHR
jgi:hypothetical protein